MTADECNYVEEQQREREEAAADWAQGIGEDASPEVPATFGAGIVVPCNCGRGDESPFGHDELCQGSVAIAHALKMAGVQGVVGGALTRDEEDLVDAISMLVRDRLGQRGGVDGDIDLGRLARSLIRRSAATICGEETER